MGVYLRHTVLLPLNCATKRLLPDSANNSQSNAVSVYWGVDDEQKAYDTLIAAGATPHEVPNEVGGGIVVAMVKDPWGNALGVIYNPPFKVVMFV